METLSKAMKKDIQLIGKFVEVYCSGHHTMFECSPFVLPTGMGTRKLCAECSQLMDYAIEKRMKCPLEAEKPSCKHCRIHCYNRAQREKIRAIMSWSGRRLMMKGRLDYAWHYFI